MDPEKVSMDRFGQEWTRALDEALPPLDLERGARAVLRARRDGGVRGIAAKWRWLAAAALLAAGVAGVLLTRPAPADVFTLNDQPLAEGARVATSHREQVIRFAGGSTIALDPESSLEVPQAREQQVAVVVARGAARFDVVKRPDASWKIAAGPFEVRVLGTAFRVLWLPDLQHFAVSVTRGTVTVSGPMLGGTRAIQAGSRCVVDLAGNRFAIEPNSSNESPEPGASSPEPASAAPIGSGDHEVNDAVSTAQGSAVPERPARAGASRSVEGSAGRHSDGWRELERQGRFDEAVKVAEHSGLDAIYDLASVEDLMSLARAARFVGRKDVSAGALLSCRRRFPGSRDAAMAAYLLGRNSPPAEAVRWFTAYLAEEPKGSWAREAAGRLIEAHAASGEKVAAREAAQKYLASYPSGPHAEFAKKVLLE